MSAGPPPPRGIFVWVWLGTLFGLLAYMCLRLFLGLVVVVCFPSGSASS